MSPVTPWEWILHVDMDSFFASVEQRDKPSLKGRPVVVGGRSGRGVVAAASYEARAYGVRSAMPATRAAQLCPEAVFLPPRFEAYREASSRVMETLRSYTPQIEPLSMDEAFLDLSAGRGTTKSEALGGDPVRIGRGIREEIQRLLGLTASVGGGRTKQMAKLASGACKPDGILIVRPEREEEFLSPRAAGDLFGVGPVTQEKLQRLGIRTVRELREADEVALVLTFGRNGAALLKEAAHGVDRRRVESGREHKSVSQEETFEKDITDRARLERILRRQTERVVARLRESSEAGRTVHVKVRYGDFTSVTRSHTLPSPTDDLELVLSTGKRLLQQLDVADGVRLVGIGVSSLVEGAQGLLPFETEEEDTVEEETQERVLRTGDAVVHPVYGEGWVEGVEEAWIRLRFEDRWSGPGRTQTFSRDLVKLTDLQGNEYRTRES